MIRAGTHPITTGMPATWMHVKDELYDSLRGPATGGVTLPVPDDFPTADAGRQRPLAAAGKPIPQEAAGRKPAG